MESVLINPVSQLRGIYLESLKYADPRVENWLMMSSPLPTAVLVTLYLLFVFIGPRIMRNQQPLNVKIPMLTYNLFMVGLSYYMFHEFLFGMLDANFTFLCDPIDRSDSPKAMRLASVCWLFYFSKFIEFMDTIFFIIRKKNNQVTFLHVYHHSSLCILWWVYGKWAPGGTSCFAPCVNVFIHVIMYSYYFLSGLGPAVQKYLWWKRYITILQLTQFVVMGSHTFYNFVTECNYPTFLKIVHMVYMITLIVLFSNFYIKSYTRKPKKISPPPSGTGEPDSNVDKKRQ